MEQPTANQPEQLLTIQEASRIFEPYSTDYVLKGFKTGNSCEASKRLYFSRTELLDYLKDSKKSS